jgi:hypothetical protein
MTTKIHSFTLPISSDYLTTPAAPLPVVHVAYKLWYNGTITDIHTNYPLDVPAIIKDWEGFIEHVKKACEVNSKTKRLPGTERSRGIGKLNDPVEALYNEWYQVYK